MDQFRPEFVLVSAGFDAHKGDPLGQLNYTDEGLWDEEMFPLSHR